MSNTTAQPATFIWHPIDGAPIAVSLYRHPGRANQRRCVVDGKTVGFVWLRSATGYRTVWSYCFESDIPGMERGSCRDRDEAVSRLMFASRAAKTMATVATTTSHDGSGPAVCGNTGQ